MSQGDLREMEQEGAVARIKKDRYVLPDTADLFPGVIHFNDKGYAFVIREETPGQSDLFITAENTWVALHGDRVLARVNREGFVDAKERRYRGPGAGQRREGRVIRILKRASETVVGTLQKSKQFFYVVADDPRFIHNVYVHPEQTVLPKQPDVGDKVVVRLEPWEMRHVNPEGKIIEVLGPAAKAGVDMLSIIRKYHLPEEFPRNVMEAAKQIPRWWTPVEADRREDLRQDFIITIDPDDARDFDDAVRVEELPGGGWRLGVHIADVSHYVPVRWGAGPGSVRAGQQRVSRRPRDPDAARAAEQRRLLAQAERGPADVFGVHRLRARWGNQGGAVRADGYLQQSAADLPRSPRAAARTGEGVAAGGRAARRVAAGIAAA